jgi:hypothetical protein
MVQRWFKDGSKMVHRRFKDCLKMVQNIFKGGSLVFRTVQRWNCSEVAEKAITQWFKNTSRQIVHRSFRGGSGGYRGGYKSF